MYRAFILLGLLPTVMLAQVAPFLDVAGHPHEAEIELIHSRGVVQGYGFGIFRPDINLNRAEFLKMTMLAAFGDEIFDVKDRKCFTDFTGTEQWFWVYACAAKEKGIVNGYPDGTFRGTQLVNLVEALKMAIEAWNISLPTYASTPSDWFAPYIDIGVSRGMFDYFPYAPTHLLTRSEMAWMLVHMGETIQYVSNPTGNDTTTPIGPSTCGNGTVDNGEQCDDGNTLDGDGCSSICVIVPEPVRHAAIRIDQRPLLSVDQSQGTKDVVLMAFDVIAGRQDIQLADFLFKADVGSLTAAQDYQLRMDTNNDEKTDAVLAYGSAQNNLLKFSSIGANVKDGQSVRFEVVADMRSNSEGEYVGLSFATDDPAYVSAVGVQDGRELTGIETDGVRCATTFSICWIEVNTQATKVVGLEGAGNLYVTKHPTPVPSYQLLAGERTPVLLALKMRAAGEDVRLTKITVNGATKNIIRLELFDESSGTPFATATSVQCATATVGQLCAQTNFVVPRDVERSILVRGVVAADTEGATSGETVALTLTAATAGAVAIEAEGTASDASLSQNDGDSSDEGEIFIGRNTPGANMAIIGSTHDIVLAKIVSIDNIHVDPENTPVPAGTSTVGVFRFSAAEHHNSFGGLNAVIITKLIFTVTATNVSVDTSAFRLFHLPSTSPSVTCGASGTTGVITVTCEDVDNAISSAITQGSFIDLGLRATVTNPQIESKSSVLQVRLNDLGSRGSPGTVEWDDDVAPFQWVDVPTTSAKSTLYRTE